MKIAHLRPPADHPGHAALLAQYRTDPESHLAAMLQVGLFDTVSKHVITHEVDDPADTLRGHFEGRERGDVFLDIDDLAVYLVLADGAVSRTRLHFGDTIGLPGLRSLTYGTHEVRIEASAERALRDALVDVTGLANFEVIDRLVKGRPFPMNRLTVMLLILAVFRSIAFDRDLRPRGDATRVTILPNLAVDDDVIGATIGTATPRARLVLHLRPVESDVARSYLRAPTFKIREMLAHGALAPHWRYAPFSARPVSELVQGTGAEWEVGDVFVDADSLDVCVANIENRITALTDKLGDLCGIPGLDVLADGPREVVVSTACSNTLLRGLATALDRDVEALAATIARGEAIVLRARQVALLMEGLFHAATETVGETGPGLLRDMLDIRGPAPTPAVPTRPPEMKIWLAVRDEKSGPDRPAALPRISRPKLAGQAMHAAHWLTYIVMRTRPELMEAYHGGPVDETRQPPSGTPKIVVKAKNLAMLERIEREARAAGIPCVSVTDEGRTEFDGVKTKTVVAFGPAFEHDLPTYLQNLQFLKDVIPAEQTKDAAPAG